MVNPYEVIDRRLSAIEQVLQELRQQRNSLITSPTEATPITQSSPPPIISKKQLQSMTGWPDSTFSKMVSGMPPGIVVRRSKRLLFLSEPLLAWLATPVEP